MEVINSEVPQNVLIETFRKLVKFHDLTYNYSDDPNSYRRGRDSEYKIRALAQKIPADLAKSIWNENVDKCLAENFRKNFYWK